MTIALLAHDRKKELMVQFCRAYRRILEKHELCATTATGRLIREHVNLPVRLLMSHKQGGHQQVNARIAYDEIDLVIMFLDPDDNNDWDDSHLVETVRCCDKHSVPLATNLACAEMLILGLERGDLDWREVLQKRKEV